MPSSPVRCTSTFLYDCGMQKINPNRRRNCSSSGLVALVMILNGPNQPDFLLVISKIIHHIDIMVTIKKDDISSLSGMSTIGGIRQTTSKAEFMTKWKKHFSPISMDIVQKLFTLHYGNTRNLYCSRSCGKLVHELGCDKNDSTRLCALGNCATFAVFGNFFWLFGQLV